MGVRSFRVVTELGRPVVLLSDLHIGTNDCDILRIRNDVDLFRSMDALVLINGDLFDAILPTDSRYETAAHVVGTSRNDLVNQVVELAVSLLAPLGKNLVMVGVGNHEYKVTRNYHVDIVKIFKYLYHKETGYDFELGNYHGYVQFHIPEFRVSKRLSNYTMYYHHGWGGSSSKSGTKLTLNDLRSRVEADIYWIGHKHQTAVYSESRLVPPKYGVGQATEREEWLISTGSYLKPATRLDDSYASYAVRGGMVTTSSRPYVVMRFTESGPKFEI